jgi:SAM-dependent methyltransferase
MRIAESNVDQARDWDGPAGEFWAERADRIDAGVAAFLPPLLAAAAVRPGDRVLDVGCGTGQLTREAARAGGAALGVDLSGPMLDLARRRAAAEGLTGARFERADAQLHPFPAAGFDVLLSRHGVMFFGDPAAAFANLARALRPGGRAVFLTWQPYERNEWLRAFRGALGKPPIPAVGPFSLSEPDTVRPLLTAAGFADVEFAGLTGPMWFGPDAADAHEFVAAQHGDGGAALRASLDAHATADGVRYPAAAWLITATRR